MVSGPVPNGKLPETSGMARAFSAWGLFFVTIKRMHLSDAFFLVDPGGIEPPSVPHSPKLFLPSSFAFKRLTSFSFEKHDEQ